MASGQCGGQQQNTGPHLLQHISHHSDSLLSLVITKRKNCHVSTALRFPKTLDLELGIGGCCKTFQDDSVYEGMMGGVVGYHRIS